MSAALIMETVLLIIRTSGIEPLDQRYAHLVEVSKLQETAGQLQARKQSQEAQQQQRTAQQRGKKLSQQKKQN